MKKVAKKAVKKVAKKAVKKVVKKAVKKVAKKPVKKVIKKIVKKPVKKIIKKTAKKVSKKAVTKVEKKAPKKTIKNLVKNIIKKAVTKTSKKHTNVTTKVIAKGKNKKETLSKTVEVQAELILDKKGKTKKTAKKGKTKKNSAVEEARANFMEPQETLDDILAMVRNLDFFQYDNDECLEKGCDQPATTFGYCRLHYITYHSDIMDKKKILESGGLQELIEQLVEKYPLSNIKGLLSDVNDDKSFFTVLKELDIITSESFDEIEADLDDDLDIGFATKEVASPYSDE